MTCWNKINKLEAANNEVSQKYDNLVAKLEQTAKAAAQAEQNCDKKIKQIKIPDIESLDFVSTEEINDLVTQIDNKLNQVGKLSDTNLKAQIKAVEETHNKSMKEIDKRIKGTKQL